MSNRLLLISTGDRQFREYLLAAIGREYRVHLFLSADASWESEYLDGITVLPSTLDAAAMIVAARELHERDPFDGVLCWDEARIIATAQIAQALGLPGGDPAVVERCRDKHQTRELLAAAGVAQPRSILVGSVEEAIAAATDIGYPVVLKPRALAASLGVVLVHNDAEVAEQFAFARDTTVPEAVAYDVSVLVEEFADGPEISVDAAVSHGEVLPICLARKEVGYAPYFEETGHLVDGADPLMSDETLLEQLRLAHRALGITDAMTHTEFRLTPSGPRLIEVNGRLGGDLIPYLGLRANGIDPGLVAAAVACGRRPDVAPDRKLFGAVAFSYVPQEMTIGSVAFDESRLPAEIDLAVVRASPGERYAPPPEGTVWGRIALSTVVADTAERAREAIAEAAAALVVTPQ